MDERPRWLTALALLGIPGSFVAGYLGLLIGVTEAMGGNGDYVGLVGWATVLSTLILFILSVVTLTRR